MRRDDDGATHEQTTLHAVILVLLSKIRMNCCFERLRIEQLLLHLPTATASVTWQYHSQKKYHLRRHCCHGTSLSLTVYLIPISPLNHLYFPTCGFKAMCLVISKRRTKCEKEISFRLSHSTLRRFSMSACTSVHNFK